MRIQSPNHAGIGMRDHPRYRGGIRLRQPSSFGGMDDVLPSFWVPFDDLGNGVVSLTENRTNATPTFSRATTAWTRLSTGLWASVASGSPRSYYLASGRYSGFLEEPSRVNRCLHARDGTNAVWVSGGGGVTPAKTQVGIDGVANSCSILTAAGADGTLLQTITSASATRAFSCWMKRSVGTGTISITLDGGTGWTDITSQINSSTFTLVQMTQAAVTNPVVGFKITTSGDAVIVDMCQEETGTYASTPIPTTTASVTRNTDLLTYPTSPWFNATEGSIFGEFAPWVAASRIVHQFDDGTANERTYIQTDAALSTLFTVVDGGATQVNSTLGTANNNAINKVSAAYKANDFAGCLNNATIATDTSGTLPTVTTLRIGQNSGGSGSQSCAHRDFRYFNRRLSNSQLQALTA